MEPQFSPEHFSPSEPTEEEIKEFSERFIYALSDILDFFEPEPDTALILQPSDLNIEEDVRSIDELHPQERNKIRELSFQFLDIDTEKLEEYMVRSYLSKKDEGEQSHIAYSVTIFSTNREGLYLHQITYSNGDIVYAVAPQEVQF